MRSRSKNETLGLLRETLRSQLSLKASAESEGAAGAAEPGRAGGAAHLPPPASHLSSPLETATTGPSVHARGQPHRTPCSNTTSSPRIKRAFHPLPPAHLKVEGGLGKSWCLDSWVLMVDLSVTTTVSAGSLAAAPLRER